MLHPHTELKFVSAEIGYGIFTTQNIPKGTIIWVKDNLDRTFTQEEISSMTPANLENVMKYTYRDNKGHYLFCWDLTRYVNHSFQPNSMLTGLDFEIAIRDIARGEEITNDYGTLNIIEPMKCAHSRSERDSVFPDDLLNFYPQWDKCIREAMTKLYSVSQPLQKFLTLSQKEQIEKIHSGEVEMPSLIQSYFDAKNET